MRLIAPHTPAEFDAVRELCWEYREYLLSFLPPPDVDFVKAAYSEDSYTVLMAALETEHVPPKGGCILALDGTEPRGCGMFHTFEPGTAEIKRIFVRETARGAGLGRAITQALIDGCRDMGFSRIFMDTSRQQVTAHKLYMSMGFVERGPYQQVPEDMINRLYYYEMAL